MNYFCIDLKSFYASVECVERGLDPMTTKLVVADTERTEKTICLAVTPEMKRLGVKNRCRLYEIPKNLEYIIAPPRMQLYLNYSAKIYGVFLKYFSSEDIHVYSVDEAFMDSSNYGRLYACSSKELAKTILDDIKSTLGLYATCGIGSNLFLAKVALDIIAKNAPDFIGALDEESYKERLWEHKPLTDFWMVGAGTKRRLEKVGIFTMKDIANTAPGFLRKLLGVNAELLYEHAHGRESATISQIKNYVPKSNSLSKGQVLARDYNVSECRLIVKEMCDVLCLELLEQQKITDRISLSLGFRFDDSLTPVSKSKTLTVCTNSAKLLTCALLSLFDEIADNKSYYRKVTIAFENLVGEENEQLDIFTDPQKVMREKKIEKAELEIKKRFGKNAILKGMNLEEAATTKERNLQIGGHKS